MDRFLKRRRPDEQPNNPPVQTTDVIAKTQKEELSKKVAQVLYETAYKAWIYSHA